MSDTKTVREKCKHNRYEGHHYRNPDYPGDGRSNPKFITKELFCQGGKEIVLRVEVAGKVTYYEGEVVEE